MTVWWHRSVCVIKSLRPTKKCRGRHSLEVASLCVCHLLSEVEGRVAAVS